MKLKGNIKTLGSTPVPGQSGIQITVDSEGSPWILNNKHQVYHWQKDKWVLVEVDPQFEINKIAAGPVNTILITN